MSLLQALNSYGCTQPQPGQWKVRLVYDFDPKQHSLEYARMKRRLSVETFRWLTEFQQDIRNRAAALGDSVQQFYIPIDLKLAITKSSNKADIVLSSGMGGREALILEVSKHIDKTHPYRGKEVIELVNQKLGGTLKINSRDILCIRQVYNIESRADFYDKPKYSPRRYSEQFVAWIAKQASENPNFFVQTREKYKKRGFAPLSAS